jgi:predicted nucleic acid-binding protein
MNKVVVLDSGPLGKIVHPRLSKDISGWLLQLLDAGVKIVLPEIADYEIRRSCLLIDSQKSIARLDDLKSTLTYLPINTEAMLTAAQLWASVRKQGFRTADDKAIDGDVILAAQAIQVQGIVATENVKHLSRLVDADEWKNIHV